MCGGPSSPRRTPQRTRMLEQGLATFPSLPKWKLRQCQELKKRTHVSRAQIRAGDKALHEVKVDLKQRAKTVWVISI